MKIAVLMGGDAPEREESLAYGKQVCSALTDAGHEVVPLDTTDRMVSILRSERPDMVYVALLGQNAEDGSVRDLLEYLDLPYVGPTPDACREAWDKSLLPSIMEGYRAAMGGSIAASWPQSLCLTRDVLEEMGGYDALDLVEDRIAGGYPVCVKPARAALGRGVFRADSEDDLHASLEDALCFDDKVVIQQWCEGVEMAVFVLGEGMDAFVLPPVEDPAGERVAPVRLASLSPDESHAQAIRAEIERAALEVYLAYGLRDFGCVDIVWDGGQARVLEVDSAPCLMPGSLFADACAASGLTYGNVLNALVGGIDV